MAQDLLKISQEAFKLQLYKIPTDQLVGLLKGIYEIKWDKGKYWDTETLMDLERKETKINAELMRRDYLNTKEYEDYFKWLSKMNYKKRAW